MSRQTIKTDKAPAAVGPYSQGVMVDGLLYTAMQIPLDPESGEMVGETAPVQFEQCFRNISAIVTAAGGDLESIIKTTVYMTDITAFGEVNRVYAGFFPGELPARGVLQVAALPKGALIAVEAIAKVS